MAPRGDSRNLSRASSPSQPSRIEWVGKDERAEELPGRLSGQEERRAAQSDGEAHQRHGIRGDRGPHEPSRQREGDPALEVARHEALALLHEVLQQPGFGFDRVVGFGQPEAAAGIERGGRRASRSPRAAISSSAVAARAASARTLPGLRCRRGPPSTDRPRASPAPRTIREGAQPAGLDDDVGRADDDAPPARGTAGPWEPSSTAIPSAEQPCIAEPSGEHGRAARRDFPRARCASAGAGPRRRCEGRPRGRLRGRSGAGPPPVPPSRVHRSSGRPRVRGGPKTGDGREVERRPALPARLAREALDHDAEARPRRDWRPAGARPVTSERKPSATAPNQSG